MYQKVKQSIMDFVFRDVPVISDNVVDWPLYVGGHKIGTINQDEIDHLEQTAFISLRPWIQLVKSILAWVFKIFFYSISIMPIVCLMIIWAAANSPEMWPQFTAELMESSTTVLRFIQASLYYSFLVNLVVWVLRALTRSRNFTFSHPNPFMAELERQIRVHKNITIHGVMNIPTEITALCANVSRAVPINKDHN